MSGRGGTGGQATAAPKPNAKTVKPSDPYANYSTAASLGYRDPDAEEAQQRMHAGTPGAWTVVTKTAEVEEQETKGGEEGRGEKRGAAEAAEEDVRAFKLRKKTASVGLGEIYDPLEESNRAGSKEEPSELVEAEPSLFRKRKGRPSCPA